MKTNLKRLHQQLLPLALSLSCVFTASTPVAQAAGQTASARISAEISTSQMSVLPNSRHPLAQAQFDTGRLPAATKLQGISLYFSRTPAQEADLQALTVAQQNPASPLYHQWLTPDQFATRFGLSDADIAKVQGWLEQQGFSIDSVARSKTMIRFSGTVAQAESAFVTQIHTYAIKSGAGVESHFAPSTDLSIPAALSGVVQGVRNLDNFRPKSMIRLPTKPQFTSGQSGNIFIAPGDINTIYDVTAVHNSYTGTGQTIAVLGQSAVVLSDIEAFQTAAGLTVKDPNIVLVPGTGTSTLYSGDEGESDLDLEWSGAIAPGAEILFVYTGNSSTSSGVFDSMQFAVDNAIAPILTISYGICEFDLGSTNAATLELITSQGATQGQTILASSGDAGSTSCFSSSSTDTTAQQEQLNVSYPASSPYVTGVGGTEFNENGNTSTYWSSNGSNDVITSALSYIPEIVWNDDTSTNGLSATGGGVSTLFSKPSWQKGVTGIPSDGKRDVPDIALDASNNNDPYLFCTSDTSNWVSGQQASCSNSTFRDAATGDLTAAGGTSFSAPIFAGMVALINQVQNYSTGQGLINPMLYTLASNSATYSTAFHDITSGDNKCTAGSSFCSGTIGYSATTGYDLTTGLGTVDLDLLAAAWTPSASTLIGTTTGVGATPAAPAVGANVTYTITVVSTTGSSVPTGTASLKLDGTVVSTVTLGSSGTATYTTSFSSAGSHVLVAAYAGDTTHAASTGTVSITASGTSSGTGTFTLAATNVTVAQGSAGSSTVTVTPSGGYTGTVQFSVTTTSSSLGNVCAVISNLAVTGKSAASTTLTIDTNAANCIATGTVRKGTGQSVRIRSTGTVAGNSSKGTSGGITTAAILGGLFFAGFLGRYSRKLRLASRVLSGVILLAAIGFALTGCGGSSSSSTSNAPKGTYTITVTGADSSTATITASANLTLTID